MNLAIRRSAWYSVVQWQYKSLLKRLALPCRDHIVDPCEKGCQWYDWTSHMACTFRHRIHHLTTAMFEVILTPLLSWLIVVRLCIRSPRTSAASMCNPRIWQGGACVSCATYFVQANEQNYRKTHDTVLLQKDVWFKTLRPRKLSCENRRSWG